MKKKKIFLLKIINYDIVHFTKELAIMIVEKFDNKKNI